MIPVTELRNGTIFEDENLGGREPYVVVKYEHIKMARGGAVVKLKVKGLKTGVVKEASFKSNDRVEDSDVEKRNVQFIYSDGRNAYFKDPEMPGRTKFSFSLLDAASFKFIKSGSELMATFYENSLIAIEFPKTVSLKVVYTEPGFKGNTATTVLKPAELETGARMMVPLFIKIGDVVKVRLEDKDYVGKVGG